MSWIVGIAGERIEAGQWVCINPATGMITLWEGFVGWKGGENMPKKKNTAKPKKASKKSKKK